MFAEAVESILQDHCTPAAVRAIEAGGSADAIRNALADAGFFELLAEEADGGAAITMQEFYPVVALCGAHAVPLPAVQTMVARLLVADHADLPQGLISLAPALTEGADGLTCALVPCALIAEHVIAARGNALWSLPVSQATRTATGVHGSLTASLAWERDAGVPLKGRANAVTAGASLQALGAVLHAGMLAGAMKRVFEMTLQYGNDRVQFGKSIGKFQAIQHQFSVMAEQVVAASIAAEAGFQCGRHAPSLLASAIAKSRTSEASQLVASIAHAVHGAIGVAAEYDLQLYTRRLHEWRMAHGSEAHWNLVLGKSVLDSNEPLLADFVRSVVA